MAVGKALRFQVLTRDNHTCRYCGRRAPDIRLDVDHVVPRALGGPDAPENLVAACTDCNQGKSIVPPGAPLVAGVAADALRWSQAMSIVVERERAQTAAQDEILDEFNTAWSSWTYNSQKLTFPRPAGWKESVRTFLAQGLNLQEMEQFIAVAMKNEKLKTDGRWKYFCGCAWRRIRERMDAAKELLAQQALGEVTSASTISDEPFWLTRQAWDVDGGDKEKTRRLVVELVTRLMGGGRRLSLAETATAVFERAFGRVPSDHARRLVEQGLAGISPAAPSLCVLSGGDPHEDLLNDLMWDDEGEERAGGAEAIRNLLREFGASVADSEQLIVWRSYDTEEGQDDGWTSVDRAERGLRNAVLLTCFPLLQRLGATAEEVRQELRLAREYSEVAWPTFDVDETTGDVRTASAAWDLPDWSVVPRDSEVPWEGKVALHPHTAAFLSLSPETDAWSTAIRMAHVLGKPMGPTVALVGYLNWLANQLDALGCPVITASKQTGHYVHRSTPMVAEQISDEVLLTAWYQFGLLSPDAHPGQINEPATVVDSPTATTSVWDLGFGAEGAMLGAMLQQFRQQRPAVRRRCDEWTCPSVQVVDDGWGGTDAEVLAAANTLMDNHPETFAPR